MLLLFTQFLANVSYITNLCSLYICLNNFIGYCKWSLIIQNNNCGPTAKLVHDYESIYCAIHTQWSIERQDGLL